jgi:hypothetical protein
VLSCLLFFCLFSLVLAADGVITLPALFLPPILLF